MIGERTREAKVMGVYGSAQVALAAEQRIRDALAGLEARAPRPDFDDELPTARGRLTGTALLEDFRRHFESAAGRFLADTDALIRLLAADRHHNRKSDAGFGQGLRGGRGARSADGPYHQMTSEHLSRAKRSRTRTRRTMLVPCQALMLGENEVFAARWPLHEGHPTPKSNVDETLVPCQALILGLNEVVRGSLAALEPACKPPNQKLTQHWRVSSWARSTSDGHRRRHPAALGGLWVLYSIWREGR